MIEAWAGQKSFRRRDHLEQRTRPYDPGNPGVDFHGERRSNDTHRSATDPEARLTRKGAGKEAKLSYAGHVLTENRNGLAVSGCVTQATGRAAPEAAVALMERIPGWRRVDVGADKGYDRKEIRSAVARSPGNPARCTQPSSAIDLRTARHPGYAVSQRKRKRVEKIFGWLKTVAGLHRTRHRSRFRVDWIFTFALAAYNLVRMRNLLPAPA